MKHTSFLEGTVNKLLECSSTMECKDLIPIVVKLLTISINASAKERLILDLRHVNQYIEKRKFKFEGVPEAFTVRY